MLPEGVSPPKHIRLRATYDPRYGGLLFTITGQGDSRDANGVYRDVEMVATLNWELYERGTYYPVDATTEKSHAQELMDDLWAAGILPSNFVDRSSLVAAMKEQIADLRKVRDKLLARVLKGIK